MPLNPYEAPQTVPPPNPNRWKGWVGNTFLGVSVLLALVSLLKLVAFFKVALAYRTPVFNPHGDSAIAFFVFAATFWYVGQWFRRRGHRPEE